MDTFSQSGIIVRCLRCGAKNHIPRHRMNDTPLCGACGARLDELIIQCIECGAKNRVSESRVFERPYCGKCGAPLYRGDVVVATDDTFDAEVLSFPGPVLVCVWRPNCMCSRIILPAVERIAPKYGGGIRVARINLKDNPQTAARYGVTETPSFLFFKNGSHFTTLSGAATEDDIERHLAEIVREE